MPDLGSGARFRDERGGHLYNVRVSSGSGINLSRFKRLGVSLPYILLFYCVQKYILSIKVLQRVVTIFLVIDMFIVTPKNTRISIYNITILLILCLYILFSK